MNLLSVRRFLVIVLTFGALFSLSGGFEHMVAPLYGYYGYVYQEFSFLENALMYFMALLPLLFLPLTKQRPGDLLLFGIYTLVILPVMAFAPHISRHPLINVLQFNGFLLLGFLVSIAISEIPPLRVPAPNPKVANRFLVLSLGLLVLVEFFCLSKFGASAASFSNFELEKVYEIREGLTESLEGESGWYLYLLGWSGTITNPFLMVWGAHKKNVPLVLFALFLQAALGSITGSKILMLTPFVSLGAYLFVKKFGRNFILAGSAFSFGFVFLMLLLNHTYSAMAIRRIFLNAPLITARYFDFFNDRSKIFFADGPLRAFFDYHYSVSIPHLIGETYFPVRLKANANANYLAEAYANWGFVGVLVVSGLLGFSLWVLNGISRDKSHLVTIGITAIFISSLGNSGFFTNFLTHGLLLSFLIIYLLPVQNDIKPQKLL